MTFCLQRDTRERIKLTLTFQMDIAVLAQPLPNMGGIRRGVPKLMIAHWCLMSE